MRTARIKKTQKQKTEEKPETEDRNRRQKEVKQVLKKKSRWLITTNKDTTLINIIWYYFIRRGKIAMKFN